VALLILTAMGLYVQNFLMKGKRFVSLSGKYQQSNTIPLKNWKWPLSLGLTTLWCLLVVLPLLTVIVASLLKNVGGEFTLSNITLSRYRYVLWELALTKKAFMNSLLYASIASTIAVVLGALVAVLIPGSQRLITNFVDTLVANAIRGVATKIDRDMEREADIFGLLYAHSAGYDPRAGGEVWERRTVPNLYSRRWHRCAFPPGLRGITPGRDEEAGDLSGHDQHDPRYTSRR